MGVGKKLIVANYNSYDRQVLGAEMMNAIPSRVRLPAVFLADRRAYMPLDIVLRPHVATVVNKV